MENPLPKPKTDAEWKLEGMPMLGDFPDTPEGKQAFIEAREAFSTKRETGYKEQILQLKQEVSEGVGKIDAEYFADMSEHDIEGLVKFATVAQLKAVLAAKHWTVAEKKVMLKPRWEKEITEFTDLEKERKDHDAKMVAIWRAIGDKTMDFVTDDMGRINPAKIIEKEGQKFAVDKNGKPYPIPKKLEFPSHLRSWIRNKMTLPEWEIAASISTEMFRIPALVQVIRWPMIFQQFRTNPNWTFELRDMMTYLKDADLDKLVQKVDPNYLPEDSEETRAIAYKEALAAAEDIKSFKTKVYEEAIVELGKKWGYTGPASKTALKAKLGEAAYHEKYNKMIADAEKTRGRATKEMLFKEVYEKNTPKDSIRKMLIREWKSGRAPNEVAGARGRNRNSRIVHSVLDVTAGKFWKDKDTEDVVREELGKDEVGLITDLLRQYQAEERGVGLMTEANKLLLNYLFCDPRSTDIARPVELLSADLQELYRALEKEGHNAGKKGLAFPLESQLNRDLGNNNRDDDYVI